VGGRKKEKTRGKYREKRRTERGAEIERKKRGKGPNRGDIEKVEGTGRFWEPEGTKKQKGIKKNVLGF